MLSRRSFLSRLGAIVATVALAPEIAFGTKLKLPDLAKQPIELEELFRAVYDLARIRKQGERAIDIFTDSVTAEKIVVACGIGASTWQQKSWNAWNAPQRPEGKVVGILEQLEHCRREVQ